MNKSRQEFSCRGKTFNSNRNAGKKRHKNKSKGSASFEKRTEEVDEQRCFQKNKNMVTRPMEKIPLTNGKNQAKGFGKKNPPIVNGIHKGFEKERPQKASVKAKRIDKQSPINFEKIVQKPAKNVQRLTENALSKKSPDTGQKRKNRDGSTGSKKLKKAKSVPSESDSDAEDYMARFFQDVQESDGEPSSKETHWSQMVKVSSSSEDEESNNSDESSESDEDGNAMSLEELVDYFGSNKDRKQKSKPNMNPKKQDKTEGKMAKTMENGKGSKKQAGWIEEDNDVELIYKDSDSEEGCRALVPVEEPLLETSEDDYDYSPEESGEEEEDFSDEDDMLSFELEEDSTGEDDSFGSEYSDDSEDSHSDSKYDDHEFSSDFESDEEEEEEDEDCPSYWEDSDSYDSEDDDDYDPYEDADDLYIGRGEARIYEIDDNNVSFNSEIDSAQIIELPSDDGGGSGRRPSATTNTSANESQTEDDEGKDKEQVPRLVPIYDSRGRLINSPKMLEKAAGEKKKSQRNCRSLEQPATVESNTLKSGSKDSAELEELDPPVPDNDEDLEDSVFARDLSMDVDNDASPEQAAPVLDGKRRTNYRFYDSIDMRMSLLVLKDTLFVSGYLTIQPLIGCLEVMGYRLKRGECRKVFAARGYTSLDLRPCADGSAYSKEIMAGVLTRLDKHFQDVDLRELEERFNPSDSVLVLLQADCNNRRIAVVDRYLPEEVMFPRVEFLKKGLFFTTEYLLNVEFFVEHVDKSTALFTADPQWNQIELRKNSRVVVMGGKGAGKSTLCQYLINRNVGQFGKMLLIDLDIGQPIQHIPETISVTVVSKPLLGVASFDPIPPVKSWLFGSLDVVSSPIFYLQNVRQLIQFCQAHSADWGSIPWIVNTMGYVTGFGEELMAAVLRMLSPTDVIQLTSQNKLLAIPNFQNTLNSDFVNRFSFNILRNEVQQFGPKKASFRHHDLAVSYPRKGFTLNAPKRRNVALLTHLARILNDSSSEWFNEVKPFRATLADLQVLITRDEDHCLAQDQLPAVLNATLVYLCRKGSFIGTYECLGIGIVRGVDRSGNVYLLQSLACEDLAEVTVLAICSSSLPSAAFLRQSARIQGSIPYVYNVE